MNNELKIANFRRHHSHERFTLSYVIRKGYFNLVRHLLDLGIDANSPDPTDATKRTPLIYCAFIKETRLALSVAQNLLEQNADLKTADAKHLTPIHYCCAFGLDELLKLFLNSLDYDLSKSFDLNGNNCVHYAVRSRSLNCLNLILAKCKQKEIIFVNVRNKLGLRPIDLEDENLVGRIKPTGISTSLESLDSCKKALLNFIESFSNESNYEYDDDDLDDDEDLMNDAGAKVKIWKKAMHRFTRTFFDEKSNAGLFFKTEVNERRSELNGSKRSNSTSLTNSVVKSNNLQDSIINKQLGTLLTQRSFLVSLKEREKYMIEFNDLFMGKEGVFENVTVKNNYMLSFSSCKNRGLNSSRNEANNVDVLDDLSDSAMSTNSANTTHSTQTIAAFLNVSVESVSWRKEMPAVFAKLENILTPSYRETVHPQVVKQQQQQQQQSMAKSGKSTMEAVKNGKARAAKLDSSNNKRNMSMTNLNHASSASSTQIANESDFSNFLNKN